MNYIKCIFLVSLSVMMLSVAGISSFYVWQKKELKQKIDQHYSDRFAMSIYAYTQQTDQKEKHVSLDHIESIKQEMRELGYSELEISMLYTKACKPWFGLNK